MNGPLEPPHPPVWDRTWITERIPPAADLNRADLKPPISGEGEGENALIDDGKKK